MSFPIVQKSELETLLKDKANFTLIDVRSYEETKDNLIETAKVLPLPDIEDANKLSEDEFKSKYNFEKPKQDDKIIFYCRSGARAGKACDAFLSFGYKNVSNYKGSAMEWFAK